MHNACVKILIFVHFRQTFRDREQISLSKMTNFYSKKKLKSSNFPLI